MKFEHTGFVLRLGTLFCLTAMPGAAMAVTRINVGDNWQDKINNNPTEKTFIIASGTHREQWVWPNNGTAFIGENGAIMKGSRVLNPASAIQQGSLYYWTGQTQESHGESPDVNNYVDPSTPDFARATYYNNELFVDDVRWKHVSTLAEVDSAGEWYFDYAADRIYMFGNPAGRLIETSVQYRAFELFNKFNIRIENLTVAQYANSIRPVGPIQGVGSRYLVLRNVHSTNNHGAGAAVGAFATVENCRFTKNGEIGLIGHGKDEQESTATNLVRRPIYIRNSEFSENNQLNHHPMEIGGWKIAQSEYGIFENNWAWNNTGRENGIELWWDEYNRCDTIRSNLIETANSKLGLFYEISGDADAAPSRIYWNTVKGVKEVALNISDSGHVWLFENAVSKSTEWGDGIHMSDGTRSWHLTQPRNVEKYRAWGNNIQLNRGVPHMLYATTPSMIEYIQGNTYGGGDTFMAHGNWVNFPTWQANGYDTSGIHTSTRTEPTLPDWAKPFKPSHYGPLPSTRVGHWRLDESSGTVATNSASNAHHGTANGNSTWLPTGGQRAGAMDFEQDTPTPNTAYVDCGTSAGSAPAMTVAFWMKADQANRHMIPVSKSSADSTGTNMSKGWAIKLRDNGDVYFRVGGEYALADISAGPGTYGKNWVHIAATFANGTAKLYVNGILKASRTGITTRSVDNTTTPLRFGKPAVGAFEPYDGLLDDVQLYSSALDQTQIQAVMGASPALKPVGNWHLDEAGGTIAADDSGNGNNGTWYHTPDWVTAKQGYGVSLPGITNFINVPDSSSLRVNGSDITLMAWIKPQAVNGWRAIISKNNTGYELDIHDGKPYVELRLNDGTLMIAETTNVEVANGSWAHVAMVRSGTSVKFYVNGVIKPVTYLTTAKSLPLATDTSPLNIGRRPVAGTLAFHGIIDEAEVYNTALSAGEVDYAKDN